jgi:hypothetical protein
MDGDPVKATSPARACFLLVINSIGLMINHHFRYRYITHWGRRDFYLGGEFGAFILTVKIRVL